LIGFFSTMKKGNYGIRTAIYSSSILNISIFSATSKRKTPAIRQKYFHYEIGWALFVFWKV
jgi:hypothetical protein